MVIDMEDKMFLNNRLILFLRGMKRSTGCDRRPINYWHAWTGEPRGETPMYKGQSACHNFWGVKMEFWHLMVFSLKRFCSRSFCGTFQGIKLRKCDRIWCVCVFCFFFYKWYLLGVKNISSHAYKTGSWYLLGVLFEISDEHSCLLWYGSPHPGMGR